jgi:hypothetical protein
LYHEAILVFTSYKNRKKEKIMENTEKSETMFCFPVIKEPYFKGHIEIIEHLWRRANVGYMASSCNSPVKLEAILSIIRDSKYTCYDATGFRRENGTLLNIILLQPGVEHSLLAMRFAASYRHEVEGFSIREYAGAEELIAYIQLASRMYTCNQCPYYGVIVGVTTYNDDNNIDATERVYSHFFKQ